LLRRLLKVVRLALVVLLFVRPNWTKQISLALKKALRSFAFLVILVKYGLLRLVVRPK
jgi:hypothetical protein